MNAFCGIHIPEFYRLILTASANNFLVIRVVVEVKDLTDIISVTKESLQALRSLIVPHLHCLVI
jgi:hypothetical protein